VAGASTIAQSCYVDLDHGGLGCKNGSGPLVTETRGLPKYHSITNAIGAAVIIRQDNDQQFRITGQQNILNDITTSIVDGELIIDYQGCFRNADIEVFVANPEITGVHNVGSGTILGDNLWQTDQLFLSITGSGRIDAEFYADMVYAEVTGSGDMDLFGGANRSFMRVTGSGDIFAFNLECNDQEIHISGSGNCEVHARDLLDVRISGSGNVFYKGNPNISTDISGSGNIIEVN
jgi:hypothetical protein